MIQKIKISALVCLLTSAVLFTRAQDWSTLGNGINATEYLGANNTSTIPLNIMHNNTVNPQPINFFTSNTQRLSIQANGALNYGTNTLNENISIGLGTTNTVLANCPNSLAAGFENTIENCESCFALGLYNQAGALAGDEGCIALGDLNDAYGHDTFCGGEGNLSNGQASAALGFTNSVTGIGSVAIGRDNVIGTTTGVIALVNCQASVAAGCTNSVLSDWCGAFGTNNNIPNGFNYSYILGARLNSGAANTITIGRGLDTNPIVNSTTNSLMIGFNSDTPTMFVGGGNGALGSSGRVGIGTITPVSKLQIVNTISANGSTEQITSTSSGNFLNNALDISVTGGSGQNRCINGSAIGTASHYINAGISMLIMDGQNVHGAMFRTFGGTTYNVGVAGMAINSGEGRLTIGTYGYAQNPQCAGSRTIGVYGEANPVNGPVCLGNYPGYFIGNIVTTLPPIIVSDQVLKTDVTPITSSLDKVNALNPVMFSYTDAAQQEIGASSEPTIGFIAQEVQQVVPEAVQEISAPLGHDEEGNLVLNDNTYLGFKPDLLIPVLTGAIQELYVKFIALEAQYSSCCSDAKSMDEPTPDHQLPITLQNGEKAILGLATPNPNDGNVSINIYLPQNISGVVEVLFTDALGQPVQIAEVTERGNVQLNINTVGLSSGTYQYTLIIDGNVEATRKMVRK